MQLNKVQVTGNTVTAVNSIDAVGSGFAIDDTITLSVPNVGQTVTVTTPPILKVTVLI